MCKSLDKLGALEWNKIVHENQAWRLITSIWLHAGVIHLLANMLSLVFIEICLEQQFGFLRVGLIYLLSGISESILSSLFIQNNISVGASGALFGLLGVMLFELLTNWTIYTKKFDWLERRQRPADARFTSKYSMCQYVFLMVSVILLIVGFTVGLVMLFKGENAND
ncbi:rhomboid-like protease 4 [Phtheirospermum japonicum]|uniref:RHOMBOID-like protein n=1 Tax=Phtheirospermum japonicum TaxID=374723 RepID=A0A830CA63_9LAMI|nr:rhomboid-like protease 4 [Phtheirospermum japonicum]